MRFKRIIATVLLTFCACSTQAAYLQEVKILSIQSYTNGTVGIVTDNQSLNPASCKSSIKYIVPSTENGVNNILSVFLTAKVSSTPVSIHIDDRV